MVMRRFLWLFALALWAPSFSDLFAQTDEERPVSADTLRQVVNDTVDIRRTTQQQEDAWASERANLVARYHHLENRVSYLADRNEEIAEAASELKADVDEFARRLEASDAFATSLHDTLLAIYERLADFVQQDLPFLEEERSKRLRSVRTELVRTDVSSAEKLRRLLEALVHEAQYGVGFEVYEADIEIGNEKLAVTMLRLGRLALFWRTMDGSRVGEFDRSTHAWSELEGSARNSVNAAFDMAMRRRQQEVLSLPLGRIVP